MPKWIMTILVIIIGSSIANCQYLPVKAVVDNRSVDVGHVAKSLDTRLNSALRSAGVHSEGEDGLYLVGELMPISEETVETGMRNIKIKDYELSLRLELPQINLMFSQTVIHLRGAGLDSTKAAIDAVKQLNPDSPVLQSFITDAITKAHDYFNTNIDAIIDKAHVLSKTGQYEEAIALLWACPNSKSIHHKVYMALDEIFIAKRNYECSMMMKKAENAYALKKYDEMAYYLDLIDNDSPCASSALALAKKAETEIRNDEKEAFERAEIEKDREYTSLEKDKQREYDLEKQRITAISDIAREFYKSRRIFYHYYDL